MAIPEVAPRPLRVAILSRSAQQKEFLTRVLLANGLRILADVALRGQLMRCLDHSIADVLLVDLDDNDDSDLDYLDQLIDQTPLPILFNDRATTRMNAALGDPSWGRRLAAKLIELVQEQVAAGSSAPMAGANDQARKPDLHVVDADCDPLQPSVRSVAQQAAEAEEAMVNDEVAGMLQGMVGTEVVEDPSSAQDAGSQINSKQPQHSKPRLRLAGQSQEASRVWVLGASIGGPHAVKEFLQNLPAGLPVAFVLAQHIGATFVTLLAVQLGRVAKLEVFQAENGRRLQNGQLMVTPVDRGIYFARDGRVELRPPSEPTVYSPSINATMLEAAKRYGRDCGAIVFSGMGNDGVVGCKAIAERGGTVWAQEARSCVISSMADAARRVGVVSLSSTPGNLATRLAEHLSPE